MIMYCKDIGEFYSIKAGEASLQKIGDLPKTFQFNAIYSGCNSPFDTLIVGENDLYGWNIGEPEVTRILSLIRAASIPITWLPFLVSKMGNISEQLGEVVTQLIAYFALSQTKVYRENRPSYESPVSVVPLCCHLLLQTLK